MNHNPDKPEALDQQHPLLSADDPRNVAPAGAFHDAEHELDDEEFPESLTIQCPLCGDRIQTNYRVLGEKECDAHPGEMHEQILIDARLIKLHDDQCEALALLRERFPDVHQPDPVLDKPMNDLTEEEFQAGLQRLLDAVMAPGCPDCGGSGYATSMDGQTLGTCTTCNGSGLDTPTS